MIIPSTSPWLPTFIFLLLSLPIIFFFTSHLLPPPTSLPDDPSDLSLLSRAASLTSQQTHKKPKSRLASTNPKPKIAFLFLTNSPLHFSPLWERFFNPKNTSNFLKSSKLYNIYVHSDPTVNPNIKPPGGVFSQDRFIPAKKTSRGTASLIAAARRLIATALLDDPDNQFFTLVSQHCIPIHSFEFLYKSLFELDSHQVAELKQLKYKSFIEIIDKDVNLWDRYTARGDNVMVPEVKFEDFRVGSQFFTLTRKHSLMVVKERRLWRKFRLPCLRPQSCYPEEHYFATFLGYEDPEGCAGYTLTRVNWTGSVDGHPHMYHPDEVSKELVYELRRSGFGKPYMFARKFSPDCLGPLMDMADEVIFRD